MANYYVNYNQTTNPGLHHEVHKEGCQYMPIERRLLGNFLSCEPAIREAKKQYADADGCRTCCPDCHTG
jgi:hypothetical protein